MLTLLLASTIVDVGFLFVLIGLAAAIVMVARVGSFVKAHLPGMELEIGQVNRAVNHVKPGEPTLIDQVRSIGAKQSLMDEKIDTHVTGSNTEMQAIESELSRHIKDSTNQFGVITGRLDQLHVMLADHLAPLPWDGKVDRRKDKETWEGVDRRIAAAQSSSESETVG